jgi:hypothetical protein
MPTTVVLIALLAGSAAAADTPRKAESDPNRLICKHSDEPGSRIQRRKVCATASEWAERKRIEMQNLLERQRNAVR